MNIAYSKPRAKKTNQFEKLELGAQEKLALYLFSKRASRIKPLLISDLYFMDQTPVQVRAAEQAAQL